MKFGDTLTRRSVAAWRNYNIDYAQIKRFIKDNTTPGNGKAVSIPGCGDECGRQLENDLFILFQSECNRVSLFTRSKRYELDSRLGSIERQLDAVSRRPSTQNPQKILKLRQRYSKIESDILSVGEEIQKLSRFTAINRTAVKKLLKKHRKWSGNTTLALRVEQEILGVGDCFSKIQLQPCLERYESFLERVRAPFTPSEASTSPGNPQSDLDGTSGVGGRSMNSMCSVYWVHRDNVTELKVLLLQHTRATRRNSVPDSHRSPSRGYGQDTTPNTPSPARDCSIVTMRSSTNEVPNPISSAEDHEEFWQQSAATAFAVTIDATADQDCRLSRRRPGHVQTSPDVKVARDVEDELDATLINVWNGDYGRPVVQIDSFSSQYEGLENSNGAGHWLRLDENIRFSKLLKDDPLRAGPTGICDKLPRTSIRAFPHAVLTIEARDAPTATLNTALESSHLVSTNVSVSI